MTSLRFEVFEMPGAYLGETGDYPIMFPQKIRPVKGTTLDEDEGLYLNFGRPTDALPFTSFEDYDHSEEMRAFDSYVLENDYIKARFIPALGGRLWSLYDKKGKRDLIYENPCFKPCNLALRNAWISGGVEWNCGVTGHHPLTCDKVYAATYNMDDGTPVLRLYAFERIRAVTYQMDFILPADSDTLFARMRLVNGSNELIPIYWWSTIATEQKEGSRVIVPASETFINHANDPCHKIPIPMVNGVDTSYPTNHKESTDHFYKIPEDTRKYEAYIDADGTGFIHSSTRRLKGRKLFVWGTSIGGNNWQKKLTSETGAPYIELQAGLAYTQQESVPFPANTAWEWLEAYSPITMKPEDVHGDFKVAGEKVMAWLNEKLPEATLEKMLADTKADALKAVPYSYKGHPWGALENELRRYQGRSEISSHLDFGETGEEQKIWKDFLYNGYLAEPDPAQRPSAHMVQKEWFVMLRKTVRGADKFNWYAWYQLALCYYARQEYELAIEMFEKSLALRATSYAYHGLACAHLCLGEQEAAGAHMVKAVQLDNKSYVLAKDALRLCLHFNILKPIPAIYEALDESLKNLPRMIGSYAVAMAYFGNPEFAKEVLGKDGGLVLHDLREGDNTFCNAYIHAVKEIAKKEGNLLSDEDVDVPLALDYRMFNRKK